ncbi:MAG: NAD-dependent epimerase/dehydratase family protein [Acidobacteria bacterium]|nr:MAG: NAD-dependent epimerase/dehydratase family protein [Acidobacteriota bacterium]
MRMLVLGGTGFLGAPLVGHLRRAGHEVAVFHRGRDCKDPEGHFHGDRRELLAFAPAFARFNPEVVIDTIAGSAIAAQRTMAAVRGQNRRVVFVSSMDVYRAWGVFHGTEAGTPAPGLLREDSPLREHSGLYPAAVLAGLRRRHAWMAEGYDKLGMERAAAAAARGGWYGRITILRLPPMYGPGDQQRRLYPLWRRMQDGRPAVLLERGWAAWRTARGFVGNMAAGVALAASDPRAGGRIFNLADGGNYCQLAWAQLAAEAAGWRGRIVTTPPALTPPHLHVAANTAQSCAADSSSIRRELGFVPPVTLAQALRTTLAWARANPLSLDFEAEYIAEDAALRACGLAAGVMS